ncbi:hypothetical protein [Lacinutrix undariae]
MKKATPLKYKNHLRCDIFGHKFEVTKHVTSHVKEYTCKCCKNQLTVNGNGDLIELTPKFKEINLILADLYKRRTQRIRFKKRNTVML